MSVVVIGALDSTSPNWRGIDSVESHQYGRIFFKPQAKIRYLPWWAVRTEMTSKQHPDAMRCVMERPGFLVLSTVTRNANRLG